TVGPSLGADSIRAGLVAGAVGALGVMIIMQICYGFSGLLANFMLAFTIGMSVDANVLIFERIREELKKGLSAFEAVQAGFSRASVSILDSNLTTLITAAILYQFGTGPIRGFAVTLSLGILASMFTAIFVSRVIFETWMKRSATQKLSV
ncbi:MAG: MMPL family transporter, partial [Mailhella sp.]|nr:MMPL family transporter [Mailhella sp.]